MSSLAGVKQPLSLLDLTFIGLGAIFGSGWLFAASHVASAAGPAGLFSWLLGAFAVFLLGFMYCELGAALPTTGGILQYPVMSHGPIVGYMMGLVTIVAYSSVIAIEVVAARQYASAWWPELTQVGSSEPTLLGWGCQFLVLCLFMLANYFSVKAFAWANNTISFFKFFVPACVIVLLFASFKVDNFTAHGFAPNGFEGVVGTITTGGVIFAYLGLAPIISSASEVRNPQRNVPLALIISISVSAVIYLLLQAAFIGSLPASMLEGGWSQVAAQLTLPFRDVAFALGIVWLAHLVVCDAVLSPAGNGNIFMNSTSRIVYGWSKSSVVFKGVAKVEPKSGIPRRALWLTFALSVAWTLPFPSWEKLIGVVSAALVLSYVVAPVSVAALRHRDFERPFRVRWLALIGPLSFIVASLLVYWSGWQVVSWLAGIQILFFVVRVVIGIKPFGWAPLDWPAVRASLWLVFYNAGLMLATWLAAHSSLDEWVIVSGLSVFAVIIYWWGSFSLYQPSYGADTVSAHAEQRRLA